MTLFQNSVLNKYIKDIKQEALEEAWNKFTTHFHDPKVQENIRSHNEEQYQAKFLMDLFVNILGYTLNPDPDYNLITEQKNEKDSKKADGAIIQDDKVIAVIELKGTNTTDLGKVEAQAFGYKSNQASCRYVVSSNFEKLRFYIDNAIDFEEFNLFQLTKERFAVLWLCLAKESVFKDIPYKIKEQSLTQEETITKQLYKDYAQFRNKVFDNIVKSNPSFDKLTLFNKTQKLLDRLLFIFFAEDRLLLPPNSIREIVKQWTELKENYDEHFPLYDRFKKYFSYMNTGYKGKQHEIFAYNGGLFAPDEVLDNIKIDDKLLHEHSVRLSDYDFESEVSVNILGHIFEHSLNDIEQIQNELAGIEIDKSDTKRKKDGIFYTPKYITKYIVDNTIGKLCTEKKEELKIIEADYNKDPKGRKKATIKKLNAQLDKYRDWLLQVTICDPACGSGAFLNQALEFLIAEHGYIDELVHNLFGDSIPFPNIENAILENNLYGVDINEESIEIAKLSLWLRTAQKGRKLTSLNNNIKCGNSLIDNKEVAGDKAFHWESEFPEVFKKGGFDVVIGNPPYVRVQMIKGNIEAESIELEKKYHSATRRYDLFVLFMEKSFSIIKDSALVSFILPHKFLIADFGHGIRNFLRENSFIHDLIHFGHELVFKDVSTYTCIVGLKKSSKRLLYKKISPKELLLTVPFDEVELNSLDDNKWELNDRATEQLLTKLSLQPVKLKNILSGIFQGIKNTSDKIFMLEGEIIADTFRGFSQELNETVELEASIMRRVAKGRDIKRYQNLNIDYYVIYPHYFNETKTVPYEENEFRTTFPKAYSYLLQYKDFLIEKKIRYKTNPKYWYSLHRARELNVFENKKIVTATIQNFPHFTIDETNALTDAGGYSIIIENSISLKLEQLLPILNSKLMWFFISNTSSVYSGGYYAFNTTFLNPFPLPDINEINSYDFSRMAKLNLSQMDILIKVLEKFKSTIKRKFEIEKLSKKLKDWCELSYENFIKELKKKKVKLSLSEEAEWQEYFEAEKAKALEIKHQIDQTDKEIDQMVYALYELTPEEIEIVEGS